MKPMIFSYDHLYTAFNNRLQIWKPLKFYTWKDFFKPSMLKCTGINCDVYDHWKRFMIRISTINICIVYGYSMFQYITRHGRQVIIRSDGDDD